MTVHKFGGLGSMAADASLHIEAIEVGFMAGLAGDWLTLIVLEMSIEAESSIAVMLEILVGESGGLPVFGRMAGGAVGLKNPEMDLRLCMAGEAVF